MYGLNEMIIIMEHSLNAVTEVQGYTLLLSAALKSTYVFKLIFLLQRQFGQNV